MINLERHIQYLLLEHNLLVVPGLGVFRNCLMSAQFHLDGSIEFPKEYVSFEATEASLNDDILAESIARRERVSLEEARKMMSESVDSIIAATNRYGRYQVADLGSLVMDSAGMLSFESSVGYMGQQCYSWLKPLEVAPLVVETPIAESEQIPEEQVEEIQSKMLRRARRAASYIAGIAMLVVSAGAISYFQRTSNSDGVNMASVGIENFSSRESVTDILLDKPGAEKPVVVLVLNTPADGVIEVEPEAEKVVAIEDEPYVLVVASLSSQAEAEEYAQAHSSREIPLAVVSEAGRYRVVTAPGYSYSEVLQKATDGDIYSTYPSAWVCRR